MERFWPYAFALFAASLLPCQAAMNGAINRVLARPLLVALTSLGGSVVFLVAVGLATGRLGLASAERTAQVPVWAWPVGVLGAVYLTSQPVLVPRLGAATFMSLSVVAQITAALLIDHFGAFNLPLHAATPQRVLGVLVMAAGVALVARS